MITGFLKGDAILYGLGPAEMRTVLSGRIGTILLGEENTEKSIGIWDIFQIIDCRFSGVK